MNSEFPESSRGWSAQSASAHLEVVERRRLFGRVSRQPFVWVTSGEFRVKFHLADAKQFAASGGRATCDAVGDDPIFLCSAAHAGAGTAFADDLELDQVPADAVAVYTPEAEPKFSVIISADEAAEFFSWLDSLPKNP